MDKKTIRIMLNLDQNKPYNCKFSTLKFLQSSDSLYGLTVCRVSWVTTIRSMLKNVHNNITIIIISLNNWLN